uniref:Uncharacterized protein n=1 Tax=Pithovirus LCPAC102 TaxID=2506587 RepID=A0A481Z652_9VIRU|nr:MAG: hypothetical protein LCPAC102_00400 [Pithovirus LCPAC102]
MTDRLLKIIKSNIIVKKRFICELVCVSNDKMYEYNNINVFNDQGKFIKFIKRPLWFICAIEILNIIYISCINAKNKLLIQIINSGYKQRLITLILNLIKWDYYGKQYINIIEKNIGYTLK